MIRHDYKTMTVSVGTATDIGGRSHNCDATAVHSNGFTTAVAIVDGIGSTPEVEHTAGLLAEVAARMATRRGTVPGLLAAHELISGPGPETPKPNAVGAVAVVYPSDRATVIAHVGDCRVYSMTGGVLTRHTTDHTVGELLRMVGVQEQHAQLHDNWVRTSIANATVATIPVADVVAERVLLTSDGIHKVLTDDQIAAVLTAFPEDVDQAAHELIAATLDAAPAGEPLDNMTAIVLHIDGPPSLADSIRVEVK
ncbi:PP2C family protein-serine/threonine phosphatase [Lentzea chajnantorensis]